jgi:hypothetical protein
VDFLERPGPTQYCRLFPGVVGHGQAFRDIDNIFSVGGLHLTSPWKIFGSAGKW